MLQHHVILLLDDDPQDQELIGLALKKTGYLFTLRTVSDTPEGIAYLRGDGKFANRDEFPMPKYILCDLKMPGGDGFELLQAMRKDPHWCTIPVIMHSGSADEDDVKKAYLLGVTAFFTKRHAMCESVHLFSTIYEFMDMAEHPARDAHGQLLPTYSHSKIGARFPQPEVSK